MTERLTDPELQALATAFRTPLVAAQLLDRAGLARTAQPHWAEGWTPIDFWREVAHLLGLGIVANGRRVLLRAAAEKFPANPAFQPGQPSPGRDARPSTPPTLPAPGFMPDGGMASHAGVFVVDAVRFSRHGTLIQLEWREGLREILAEAFARAGIPADAVLLQDRGDGFLGIVSPAVPKATIAADLVREVRIALRAYNATRNDTGRIRLRMALHHGEIIVDGTGFAGDPAIVAARLVDAPPVRQALEAAPAEDLGVIVSADMYDSTIRLGSRGLDPAGFLEVKVSVPKFSGTAWVQVLQQSPVAADTGRSGAADAAPAEAAGWDFLVSCADRDEGWGAWIAWQLERHHYRVHLETWDSQAGSHDPQRLNEAIRNSERTLVVLSQEYLRSEKVQDEWQAAWLADRTGMLRKLIPVRVEECTPDGLLRGITYIDLVGLPGEDAEIRLIERVKRSIEGKYRPAAPPPFPGAG